MFWIYIPYCISYLTGAVIHLVQQILIECKGFVLRIYEITDDLKVLRLLELKRFQIICPTFLFKKNKETEKLPKISVLIGGAETKMGAPWILIYFALYYTSAGQNPRTSEAYYFARIINKHFYSWLKER